jgi:hypothetical protein
MAMLSAWENFMRRFIPYLRRHRADGKTTGKRGLQRICLEKAFLSSLLRVES